MKETLELIVIQIVYTSGGTPYILGYFSGLSTLLFAYLKHVIKSVL